ncbi:hypothetical protein [Massilia endophytica]|uniref:hypothetical protein n=1 Tax=Massilia endophytica TaxID=2899220 RepID=UPI001E3A1BBE|nr:hypothetical protein [Massilia endophytica]UGQ46660.1 hypothetical protein LSQ66_23315 [Massilia endophytica]
MNIALPAIVIFLLLLPGFIFRSRIKRAERTSLDYSPFGQVVTEGVLWSIGLHTAWLTLASATVSLRLDTAAFLGLLISDPNAQSRAVAAISGHSANVAGYAISLIVFSYFIPKAIRLVISKYRLDRAGKRFSSLFRFHQAPWYYLLTVSDREDEPAFVVVSAIVNVAGEAILFTGIVDEFFVDPEGRLDRLVLEEVMRRPITVDKPRGQVQQSDLTERFYPIDGDYFVLRYNECITLNIEYIRLNAAAA